MAQHPFSKQVTTAECLNGLGRFVVYASGLLSEKVREGFVSDPERALEDIQDIANFLHYYGEGAMRITPKTTPKDIQRLNQQLASHNVRFSYQP